MSKLSSKKDNTETGEIKPNYTRALLGTYWDPQRGEWMLAKAKFDPVTLQATEVTSERVAGDSLVMMDQLYIKQIQLNFYEKEPVRE